MAEPESAVLPITPYPIGCLSPQVTGYFSIHQAVLRAHRMLYRADVQTTKDSRTPFHAVSGLGGGRRGPINARAQAGQAAVAAEQLQ